MLEEVHFDSVMKPSVFHTNNCLILEDNPFTCELLDTVMSSIEPDMEIIRCLTFEEALADLRFQSDRRSTPYNLVIADIFLEGRETGLDFWQHCSKLYPTMPFAIVSGAKPGEFYDLIPSNEESPLFIQKPFSIHEIRSTFSYLLNTDD